MNTARLLLAALAMSGAVSAPAMAQRNPPPPEPYQEAVPPPEPVESTNNKALDRRLDRDEKALRELRSIVLKAQAQGSPVEVKPAGPDPVVSDLQARFGDLETTIRGLTGQVESLRQDLDQTRRDLGAATTQINSLNTRIESLQQQQLQPAPPLAAAAEGAPVAGPPPAPEAAVSGNEEDDYRSARQVLDSGDFAGGAAAMQAFVARYPNSPRAPTAYYWTGRAFGARNQPADAAAAYARSLKGWPQTAWAGDAVVQLAGALTALKRPADACKALVEYDARYAAKAGAATKALAVRARTNAACT